MLNNILSLLVYIFKLLAFYNNNLGWVVNVPFYVNAVIDIVAAISAVKFCITVLSHNVICQAFGFCAEAVAIGCNVINLGFQTAAFRLHFIAIRYKLGFSEICKLAS